MTLCVAAIASGEEKNQITFPPPRPRIVACFDRLVGGELGTTDTAFKIRGVAPGWIALYASNEVSTTLKLLDAYVRRFYPPSPRTHITARNCEREFSVPARTTLRALREESVQSQLSVSLKWFYEQGKNSLDKGLWRRVAEDVRQITLESELLIFGFAEEQWPTLLTVDGNGRTRRAAVDFAAVGIGQFIARAALLRRDQTGETSLGTTLYQVMEAKLLGERASGVGRETLMGVYAPPVSADSDMRLAVVSKSEQEELETMFKEKYGPRPVPDFIPVPNALAEQLAEQIEEELGSPSADSEPEPD